MTVIERNLVLGAGLSLIFYFIDERTSVLLSEHVYISWRAVKNSEDQHQSHVGNESKERNSDNHRPELKNNK